MGWKQNIITECYQFERSDLRKREIAYYMGWALKKYKIWEGILDNTR